MIVNLKFDRRGLMTDESEYFYTLPALMHILVRERL